MAVEYIVVHYWFTNWCIQEAGRLCGSRGIWTDSCIFSLKIRGRQSSLEEWKKYTRQKFFMKRDLTQGNVMKTMLLFAGPMHLGNLLQQCYNIADTLLSEVSGCRRVGGGRLWYTLMTFLTSILTGLCMGSAAVFSYYYGRRETERMKNSVVISFMIGGIAIVNAVSLVFVRQILRLLQSAGEIMEMMPGIRLVDILWDFFCFFV